MAEYIKRSDVYDGAVKGRLVGNHSFKSVTAYIDSIPAAEVVSKELFNQTVWERNVAITQLTEIGKGLGAKMDDVATVVRCKDCYLNECCSIQGAAIWVQGNDPNFYCGRGQKR